MGRIPLCIGISTTWAGRVRLTYTDLFSLKIQNHPLIYLFSLITVSIGHTREYTRSCVALVSFLLISFHLELHSSDYHTQVTKCMTVILQTF